MADEKPKVTFEITQTQIISAGVFIMGLALSFYIRTSDYQSATNARLQIIERTMEKVNIEATDDRREIKNLLQDIKAKP